MIFRLGFFFPWDLNEEAKIDYTQNIAMTYQNTHKYSNL